MRRVGAFPDDLVSHYQGAGIVTRSGSYRPGPLARLSPARAGTSVVHKGSGQRRPTQLDSTVTADAAATDLLRLQIISDRSSGGIRYFAAMGRSV
jgi:hypothetical protein